MNNLNKFFGSNEIQAQIKRCGDLYVLKSEEFHGSIYFGFGICGASGLNSSEKCKYCIVLLIWTIEMYDPKWMCKLKNCVSELFTIISTLNFSKWEPNPFNLNLNLIDDRIFFLNEWRKMFLKILSNATRTIRSLLFIFF